MYLNCKVINLVGIFFFLGRLFSRVKSLDKRKYIAWTVDHMPYHILVEDAIIDYNTLNTLDNPRVKKKKKKHLFSKNACRGFIDNCSAKKSTKNEIHELGMVMAQFQYYS